MPERHYFSPCRHVPHDYRWQCLQTITFRVHNSLPRHLEKKIRAMRKKYNSPCIDTGELSEEERKLFHNELDKARSGINFLQQPDIANIILKNIFDANHNMYDVIAWCIMPNHVHLILFIITNISDSMKHIKGCSARHINRVLGTTGRQFWARDYFDRYVRSVDHYQKAVKYLLENPVKGNASNECTGIIPDYLRYTEFIQPYVQDDGRFRTPLEPWLYPLESEGFESQSWEFWE